MNEDMIQAWNDFKKKMTWDHIKALLCVILPLIGFFYLYLQWIKLVNPIMDEYSKATNKAIDVAATQHDAIISLCLVAGFVAPIFLAFPTLSFGIWLGKALGFYKDDKTRSVWWDDVTYYVRDMPQDQRNKVKEILSPYKSKLQLRKERKANESWLRRTFT